MNRKLVSPSCFLIVLLLLSFVSCKHELDVPMTPAISFSNDVKPVIITNCTQSSCHGTFNFVRFQLLTYENIMEYVKTGNNATSAKLYKIITGKGEGIMPPSPYSPLTDEQIKSILLWMRQGAKNN